MRERKFKVWDKQEKRMLIALVDDLISLDMNGWIYCNGEFRPEYQKRFIVLFWTGLNDKNGKEIFEGDIMHDDKALFPAKWEIMFKEGKFVAKANKIEYYGNIKEKTISRILYKVI